MIVRAFLISSAICIASLYGAYSEYKAYDPAADARAERDYIEQKAHFDATEETKRRISEDCGPGDQYTDACSYNSIYHELLPMYRERVAGWVTGAGRAYSHGKGYGSMGGLLFIALIAGWFAYVFAREKKL